MRKGIRYLVRTQNADGTWTEAAYTGTGFPRTFYLRYDLYRLYFPLLALSRFSEAIAALEKPEHPEQLVAQVPPGERILLLPHCLRRSAVCAAKPSEQGLQCASCTPACPINQLRRKALDLGYREVCVASGGGMALKHVAESKPLAVVAVACAKELAEGIEGVKTLMSRRFPAPADRHNSSDQGPMRRHRGRHRTGAKSGRARMRTRTLRARAGGGFSAGGPLFPHHARPRPQRCPFGKHEESLFVMAATLQGILPSS